MRNDPFTFHMTPKSSNVKTGAIPVTTSTALTCPTVCPFNHANAGGCYAEQGPLKIHWLEVTAGNRGGSWMDLVEQIEAMPEGTFWRHNQAGDLHGDGETIDVAALDELVAANKGKRGFTYTHYELRTEAERDAVKRANENGFTVNLSANNLAHADELAKMDIAPVATVLPLEYQRTEKTVTLPNGKRAKRWAESVEEYRARVDTLPQETPEGRRVVVCPATYRDDVTCQSCKLCGRLRDTIVGFPAHGTAKKRASAIAEAA